MSAIPFPVVPVPDVPVSAPGLASGLAASLPAPGIPHVSHIGAADVPFVTFMPGLDVQVLHIDVPTGLWVVTARFAPGLVMPRHQHTGEVFAVTRSGAWRYLEYPEVNVAGSYLYEPAGSIHTLTAPASNQEVTEAWFAIRGANLNLNADGQVESVWDAAFIRDTYFALCEQAGHPRPPCLLR